MEKKTDKEIEKLALEKYPVIIRDRGRTLAGGHYDIDINLLERRAFIAGCKTVFCAICGKPITETGTAYEGRPVHIECYHKAKQKEQPIKSVKEEEFKKLPKKCQDTTREKDGACKYPLGTCELCKNNF